MSSFGDTLEENVPYFWSLAIRESLAADLCALSIVEYDQMPLSFYRDMAKQSWDEMRHSTYFFDLALTLIPELVDQLDTDHPLHANLTRFLATREGLPIPRERNLYEAILNASLVERLVLLHRDTETPGILRIKEKINSEFCSSRPHIGAALEIVMRDEVTHSRFGNVWLKHLIPDARERQDAIATTELLRGVLLLSAFAHHGGGSLGQLLSRYSQGETAPPSPLHRPTQRGRPQEPVQKVAAL